MPSRPRSGGRGPGPAEGRITKDGGRGRGPGRTGPRGGGCLRSRRAAPGRGPGPARSRRDRRPPPARDGSGEGGRWAVRRRVAGRCARPAAKTIRAPSRNGATGAEHAFQNEVPIEVRHAAKGQTRRKAGAQSHGSTARRGRPRADQAPLSEGEGSGLGARGRRPPATTAGLPNGWSIPYRPTHRGRVLRAAGPVPVPRHGGSGRRDRLGSRPPAAAGGFHLVPLMDPGSLPRFAPGSLPAAGAHRSRIAGPMCPRGSRAAVARRSLEGDGPCCEDSTPPPAA